MLSDCGKREHKINLLSFVKMYCKIHSGHNKKFDVIFINISP